MQISEEPRDLATRQTRASGRQRRTTKRRWRIRTGKALSVVLLMIGGVVATTASPAGAGVYGWGQGTYIYVETGAKNYTNRTQWVGTISVIDGAGRCDWGTAEAWISRPGVVDWYRSREICNSHTFYVSRWVPS